MRVSSPISTGGAGTTFEQHVGAYWLTVLLVRGIPPIVTETLVTEVSFQTERLGWHTDDLLIVCERTGAAPQKLAVQVKRSFTVSATDEDCIRTIGDFWLDFNSPQFSQANDRLVLVTLRGTNTLLEHFTGLLDCARASRNGIDFAQRLDTDGFISDKAVDYCRALQKIVGDIESKEISSSNIWPLLRVLHVLSLDLNSATRQSEAQMKSLLAHTSREGNPVAAAGASWHELVGIASTAMSEARTLRREDLPGALLERHSAIGTEEQHVLEALKGHTDFTLGTIRSTIGTEFHLQRAALVQRVLEALGKAQVVLVAGPAGSGKSVVAKDTVSVLTPDHFIFAFRVEEFAEAHLDRTLAASNIPANAAALRAILAAQGRKVFLVESVERLLEKTTRDSFSDLMALARGDRTLGIVLTCRDYSVEQVTASFLQPAGIAHIVIQVPPLDGAELGQVEAAHPALALPLQNPSLRNLLSNPFFLDKALGITWSADKPLPESERELRILFWREVIRADHRVLPGVGRRREEALQAIAVRRARSLSAYVLANDQDPSILESLRRDSLIDSPEISSLLVATTHDVLEDWAILQWLEEQHLTNVASFKSLAAAIGPHPAVRRAYRKWLAELLDRDATAADLLFLAAISEDESSAQFRDDTLVSLLKAPSAPDFLERHEVQLLANERTILKRVIHLLRVACVKSPPWLQSAGSLFSMPDGPVWADVLRIVERHKLDFSDEEHLLLLGLIEDWTRGVHVWTPYPDGAIEVAAIAHWLLPQFDTYRPDGPGQRILRIIAKIPRADRLRFEALLYGRLDEGDSGSAAEKLQELIFADMEGMPAARDEPDLLFSLAQEYIYCTEEDLKDQFGGSALGVEVHFGIKDHLHLQHFPASAYRGPWLPLLRHHPRRGMDLIIAVFNHSVDWYARPRTHDRLEPARRMTLTFEDGTSRTQWVNERLWSLYRGTAVAPYVLESMAMALERWLLELAESEPETIDNTLLDLLRRSESGALTAVAASIATAFPDSAGETLLALLGAFEPILLDKYRLVKESSAPSIMSDLFPRSRGANQIYEEERKYSDGMAHRKRDLETVVLNLQLGPLVKRAQDILDALRATLPPEGKRSTEERVRLLALGRMDLRQYYIGNAIDSVTTDSAATETPHPQLRLEPKQQEDDVQRMVDENAARVAKANERLAVLMWGLKVFSYEQAPGIDADEWRNRLQQARNLNVSVLNQMEVASVGRGPSVVAAVCVRDHWDEMSLEEREWCTDRVCAEIMHDVDTWDQTARIQRYAMSADRSCASVISLLMGKELSCARREAVRQAFVNALTHPITEVQWHAIWGIARHLWPIEPLLVVRCVDALAYAATQLDEASEIEKAKPYGQRKPKATTEQEIAGVIRRAFWTENSIPSGVHGHLDLDSWFGAEASARILTIFSEVPQEPLAIAAYARATAKLAEWWDERDSRRQVRASRRSERDYETELAISEMTRRFVLRTSRIAAEAILKPILDTIDRAPSDLHWFMRGLTMAEDQLQQTEQFWFVWNLFADKVRLAPWTARLESRSPTGEEVISAIFLGASWKDNIRHWRSLEEHIGDVDRLFDDLPPSSLVLDDYIGFLYHIGERSLPQAFVRIERKLRAGDIQQMTKKGNTVFMLEALLQRYVYGRPLELKSNPVVQQAILGLLDVLVENGSSAAFRMRDDFVTPISVM